MKTRVLLLCCISLILMASFTTGSISTRQMQYECVQKECRRMLGVCFANCDTLYDLLVRDTCMRILCAFNWNQCLQHCRSLKAQWQNTSLFARFICLTNLFVFHCLEEENLWWLRRSVDILMRLNSFLYGVYSRIHMSPITERHWVLQWSSQRDEFFRNAEE